MRILNYTPHIINETETGKSYPSDGIARVESITLWTENTVGGVRLCHTTTGKVIGLPEQEEGIYILVSGMVLDASDRGDLLAPGELVRNDAGQPIGCRGFRIKGE